MYYQKENGDIPALEFLLSLNPKIRAKTFKEIELLEKHGHNLREPYVKLIKGEKYKGIFELRVKFANNIVRVFYFTFTNNTFVMLNGFMKKTDKTPENELDRAKIYKERGVEKMSKAGIPLSEIKEKLMKDEEFKKEYEKLKPRYELISQIIEARK